VNSVRSVAGNHAFQPTAASRPMLRQSPILGAELVTNGDFSAGLAGWVAGVAGTIGTLSAGAVLVQRSADSVTNTGLSTADGTAQVGKTYQVEFDILSGSGNILVNEVLTVAAVVGRKRYTVTNTRSRAFELRAFAGGSATVDNISVKEITGYYTDRNYLAFDGSDDSLLTNSINFTSTDKVSIFAGVRKLSDAASSMLCELSASLDTINGAFNVLAPGGGGVNKFVFSSRGTKTAFALTTNATYNAPHSAVTTGFGNISGGSAILRVNGAQVAQSTADQGTGNYGNHQLYIGRRGGTSLPFNGHLYSLVIVGRLTTDTETRNTERLIAKQAGVQLA
jgi:hypothetical protein